MGFVLHTTNIMSLFNAYLFFTRMVLSPGWNDGEGEMVLDVHVTMEGGRDGGRRLGLGTMRKEGGKEEMKSKWWQQMLTNMPDNDIHSTHG